MPIPRKQLRRACLDCKMQEYFHVPMQANGFVKSRLIQNRQISAPSCPLLIEVSLSNFLLGLPRGLSCSKYRTPIFVDLDVVDLTIDGVLIWGENDQQHNKRLCNGLLLA